MDKVAKLILNSLKCPVCSGQIDLLDWTKLEQKPKDQNFSCVYDPEHFGIFLVHWEQPIRIEFERATVYEGKHKFVVKQQYYTDFGNKLTDSYMMCQIQIFEVDPEHRVLDSTESKIFSFNKYLFDFTKTNREKLVNRIKTILTFQ